MPGRPIIRIVALAAAASVAACDDPAPGAVDASTRDVIAPGDSTPPGDAAPADAASSDAGEDPCDFEPWIEARVDGRLVCNGELDSISYSFRFDRGHFIVSVTGYCPNEYVGARALFDVLPAALPWDVDPVFYAGMSFATNRFPDPINTRTWDAGYAPNRVGTSPGTIESMRVTILGRYCFEGTMAGIIESPLVSDPTLRMEVEFRGRAEGTP